TDSDYQLVADAQTPAGLNNQTPPELPSYEDHTKRNNSTRNGDLFENFKNNRERYPSHTVPEEVTYAELCLARPTTLQDMTSLNCMVG
ncbi:unnamed protein product, partial [Timema podura]|nr:unnamed protein product [Timema podura]